MPPTDLVVVVPGILGSTLRRDGHLVWAPSAGAALRAITTFGASIRRLQLPGGIGDEYPGDGVEPAGVMPDLHVLPGIWTPVKGYDVLLNRLRSGDATVPIVGACRSDVPLDSNTLRRVPDKHGNLQRNPAALDELEGILTAQPVTVRAPRQIGLRADAPEFALAGEAITVQITPAETTRHAVRVTVTSETGRPAESRVLRPARGTMATTISGLAPGAYTIDVTGVDPGSPLAPVSSDIPVWG